MKVGSLFSGVGGFDLAFDRGGVGDVVAGAFHVKISQWPVDVRALLESGRGFGSSSIAFLRSIARLGLSLRTSPACYPRTEGGTLPSSFEGWSNSGMALPGRYWTLSTSESPSGAVASSLSAILETTVPRKYYLSPKACAGILRRAAKRGRQLPMALYRALSAASEGETIPEQTREQP